MLKPFSDYLLNEWAVLSGAPSTFVIGALFLAGLAYAAARWRYTATIEGLKERLQLRDDRIADYERKLEGATPDEAKQRIDDLEATISALPYNRHAAHDIWAPQSTKDVKWKRYMVLAATKVQLQSMMKITGALTWKVEGPGRVEIQIRRTSRNSPTMNLGTHNPEEDQGLWPFMIFDHHQAREIIEYTVYFRANASGTLVTLEGRMEIEEVS